MPAATVAQAINAALAHHRAGRLAEAETLYRQILQREPRCVEAIHLLALLAEQAGQFAAAEQLLRQAIDINGGYPEGWNNLGNVLRHQNRLDEAAAAFSRAIALNPNHADAHHSVGNLLHMMGKREQAIAHYRRAIELKPDLFGAIINLGNALYEQGNYADAEKCCRRAIELQPNEGRVWSNLGSALDDLGRMDEAIEAFERAIALSPDYAAAHGNYGNALKHAGRVKEAMLHYRRSLELQPRQPDIHSNMLYAMHVCSDFGPAELLSEHRRWAEIQTKGLVPLNRRTLPDSERRLRIGYVSPDFRMHAVGWFLPSLLENHDHAQFEIVCFSNVDRPDSVTTRFQKLSDRWHDTAALDDHQLANLIAREEIDVLVDLSLHSAKNRMMTFAFKPAPVQVTYLAYPSTSGLPAMDYRFTDEFLDPPDADANYVEQSVRLKTYWCYQPLGTQGDVSPLPALKARFATFGCLNSFTKVSDEALATWAKVLDAVPGSKLVLVSPVGSHRRRVTDALGTGRLEFIEVMQFKPYIENYHRIDIGLDPMPYCGGTTTCDAMWMGVPVITLAGKTAVGRGGVSLLNQICLSDLVAQTNEDYIHIAAELAKDLPRLAEIRAGLRERMSKSPLCDAVSHARDIESKYRWMWRKWCEAAAT